MSAADLTVLVPEHIDNLLNMPSPDSNRAGFHMPERAALQLSLSAQLELGFQRLFAPFQAFNNSTSDVPKASENLATDFTKLNSAPEVPESH